jgi:hypothetical protein
VGGPRVAIASARGQGISHLTPKMRGNGRVAYANEPRNLGVRRPPRRRALVHWYSAKFEIAEAELEVGNSRDVVGHEGCAPIRSRREGVRGSGQTEAKAQESKQKAVDDLNR